MDDYMPGFRSARWPELYHASAPRDVRAFLDEIRSRVRAFVQEQSGLSERLYVQYSGLESVGEGGKFTPHADNCAWSVERQRWEPAEYSFRCLSAIVYLNESGRDYEGGVFEFLAPQVEHTGRLTFSVDGPPIVPTPGRLLVFSSGEENVHRVSKVARGRRYTLAMWFARTRAVCEPQSFEAGS